MLEIIYRIDPKVQGERKSLSVFLEEGVMQNGQWVKERPRKIYLADVKKRVSKREGTLLDFLAAIQQVYVRQSGLGSNLETIELNHVELSGKKIFEFFQLVTPEHLLFFQKERIFLLLQKPKFYFLAKRLSSKEIEAEGKISWSGEDFSLAECSFLLPSEKILFLRKGKLGFLETEISWKWLDKLSKGPLFLKDAKALEEECETCEIKYLEVEEKKEIHPVLILQDPTLSFADLYFDYGGTIVPFQSSTEGFFRNKEQEKNCEKDLLEIGFQKKDSHYFCPTEKIAEALELLLAVGWSVKDFMKRTLVPMSSFKLSVREKGEEIEVDGEVFFSDASCRLSQIVTSLKGRTSLLDLGGKKVALLDPKLLAKSLPLQVKIPKCSSSVLAPFLQENRVEWEEKIHSLVQGLTGPTPESPILSSFTAKLYPYQKEGVDWLYFIHQSGLGGLLADEMGLGKTVQVLAFFSLIRSFLPILVICPSSLLYNWKAEMRKFLPDASPYLHIGKDRKMDKEELQKERFIFTTYTLLRIDLELFSKMEFSSVVLDESSAIKNDTSLTAQAASRLKAQSKFALNGTPIENRYEELWSQLHFLQPNLLGSKKDFLESIVMNNFGQIRQKMRPFYLKRTKEKVELQLPEKNEQIVWVEMEEDEREIYESLRQDARALLGEEGDASNAMQVLEKILRLRQTLCHPLLVRNTIEVSSKTQSAKFQLFLNDIEELQAQKRKVLIYSQFTEMLTLMENEFKARGYSYCRLDGKTEPEERQRIVSSFQEDPSLSLFLISLKAGGVGLTLTAADYVFLYDPWWNEAVENQAIDRAHRIGRSKALFIKKYLTVASIEENMLELKQSKTLLSQNLDHSNGNISLTKEDWLHLLR